MWQTRQIDRQDLLCDQRAMTWITSCSAPDLSDLEHPLVANYFLNVTFLRHSISDSLRIRAWGHVLIACVDKTIRNYCDGRQKLIDYAGSSNKTSLLFAGLGDFESCVNGTKRCLRVLNRLASDCDGPAIERTLRKSLESLDSEVTRLRDEIEHMDERIAEGSGEDGGPQLLLVTQDGTALCIGAERIEFARLAICLRKLHSVAKILSKPDA